MPAKKPAKPKASAKPKAKAAPQAAKPAAGKKLIGTVNHFFDKISVAVVDLNGELKVGDKISIEGPQTNFTQTVSSMQIEHEKVATAKKGQSVGMKVSKPVRKKDQVFKA